MNECKRKFGVSEDELDCNIVCKECGERYGAHIGLTCPPKKEKCQHGILLGHGCIQCDEENPPAEFKGILSHMDIKSTLDERGSSYGDYKGQCAVTRSIKRAIHDTPNWEALSDDKKESLDMIAVKMGRILNGDPEYHDSWHDISGYTELIAKDLEHGRT